MELTKNELYWIQAAVLDRQSNIREEWRYQAAEINGDEKVITEIRALERIYQKINAELIKRERRGEK